MCCLSWQCIFIFQILTNWEFVVVLMEKSCKTQTLRIQYLKQIISFLYIKVRVHQALSQEIFIGLHRLWRQTRFSFAFIRENEGG